DSGVAACPEPFVPVTEALTEGADVSEAWRRGARTERSRFDQDFLGLAACELWKRYCPENPSIEMLDDWMQEGYRLVAERAVEQACDWWQEVWDVIRPRLQARMRTCDEASVVFTGTQCLFNWVQDFAEAVQHAAHKAQRYGAIGARFCREILGQFTGEDDLFRNNFRADLGELHFLAGQDAEGERVLLDLIADHPDRSQGYARLSDMFSCGANPGSPPRDLPRAIRILEEALARPVADVADYDLALRLEDLREEGMAHGLVSP
ncbi:MAG: hypothetical protein M0Z94_07070, partial [Dehalococcoidales bacterium]|nr:hypothetical protein [Dehalococcoidales bacterium]